jgi:hypothetical protein
MVVKGRLIAVFNAASAAQNRHPRACREDPRLCPATSDGRFHGKTKNKAWMLAPSASMTTESGRSKALGYRIHLTGQKCDKREHDERKEVGKRDGA